MSQKVLDRLKEGGSPITFSVEITPPLRGTNIDTIFQIIDEIRPYGPKWIDVTSHGADTHWVKSSSNGGYQKRLLKKSPGTIAICAAIEHKFNIPTVPHLLCNGFTREETEDGLIDLHYLGVRNVLAVRGDGNPKPMHEHESANHYALELVEQVARMNQGFYLHQEAEPTDFNIGVACYPEKHFESPNQDFCVEQLEKKEAMGAHYAVSQMFFDCAKFFDFTKKLKNRVTLPIIPALKILTSARQLQTIPKHFYVDLPQDLVNGVRKAHTNEEIVQVGVNWAVNQCLELIDAGEKHLHFYIMKRTLPLLEVMQKLEAELGQKLKHTA